MVVFSSSLWSWYWCCFVWSFDSKLKITINSIPIPFPIPIQYWLDENDEFGKKLGWEHEKDVMRWRNKFWNHAIFWYDHDDDVKWNEKSKPFYSPDFPIIISCMNFLMLYWYTEPRYGVWYFWYWKNIATGLISPCFQYLWFFLLKSRIW